MEGRPIAEYIRLNEADNPFSARSTILRIGLNGCPAGTRSSGDT
jgi:hypothetical protein